MLRRDGCAALLSRHIARHGDRSALTYLHANGSVQSLSWSGVARRVARLVGVIDRLGFKRGDRLVHSLGNTGDGVVMAIASLIAGTIEVPLPSAGCAEATGPAGSQASFLRLVDGKLFDDEVADVGRASDIDRGINVDRGIDLDGKSVLLMDGLGERESLHDDHQAALILFTSGSAGTPRGVTLSRRNLVSNAQAKLAAVPQRADDVRLTVLPIWHAYARTCDLMTWLLSGCSLVIAHGWAGWQQLAPCSKPTLINTVPSIAGRLLAEAMSSEGASRLRVIGCGGAAMPSQSFAQFTDLGISVIQGYGLTEASPVVCSATPDNARADHVGLPIAGCETRVGLDGRLSIRGEGVMLGYWDDADSTAKKISDGWLDTGDCIEVDPSDGQFRILGRADDRITLSNGLKFFPASIEKAVASLPGIRHALLVANGRWVDLFVDLDTTSLATSGVLTQIERTVCRFPTWQRPRDVIQVTPSFANLPGTMTLKGTLCRPVAMAACLQMRQATGS